MKEQRIKPDSNGRARIVDAAFALFRDNGYGATSIDRVVATAKVSKRTFYEHFRSKNDLLEQVISTFTATAFDAAEALSRNSGNARQRLRTIARLMHRSARSAESIALIRMQISEAQQLGDLPRRLQLQGLRLACDLMREPLVELATPDPDAVASVLYDLLVVAPIHRRLLGASESPVDIDGLLAMVLDQSSSGS